MKFKQVTNQVYARSINMVKYIRTKSRVLGGDKIRLIADEKNLIFTVKTQNYNQGSR